MFLWGFYNGRESGQGALFVTCRQGEPLLWTPLLRDVVVKGHSREDLALEKAYGALYNPQKNRIKFLKIQKYNQKRVWRTCECLI